MPLKELFSPFKNGVLKDFKFGGGANTIVAFEDPDNLGIGYQSINGGGGNDTITGSKNDDVILGGDGSDILYGDLGDDEILGGDALGEDSGKGKNPSVENYLYGDALFARSGVSFTGGDDVLHGSDDVTKNTLFGDVASVSAADFTGGNDRLIGGTNSIDHMYGDWSSVGTGLTPNGGENTFVIKQSGGHDTIFDFRSTDDDPTTLTTSGDKVELSGFDNINNFDDLTGRWFTDGVNGFIALDLDGTLSPNSEDGNSNRLVFFGYADETGFSADDFFFT